MAFQINSRGQHVVRLKHIVAKQRANERVMPYDYLNAVVNESKYDRNYANAEEAFVLFLKHLNHGVPLRPHKKYIHDEIMVFQRSISTLVRYAPGPQKALDYSAYLLAESPPLRDENVETVCLINLIFVHKIDGSPDAMNKALELIQVGLDRKVHCLTPRMNDSRDNVAEVFTRVSQQVLAYHNLQFSADMTTLEPSLRRPHRFSTY